MISEGSFDTKDLSKQLGSGQAEVEADHSRSELGQHGGMFPIEWRTTWRCRNG